MFLVYGAFGLISLMLYRQLSHGSSHMMKRRDAAWQVEAHVYTLALSSASMRLPRFCRAIAAGIVAVRSLPAFDRDRRYHILLDRHTQCIFAARRSNAGAPHRFDQHHGVHASAIECVLILVPLMPNLPLALLFLMLRSALSKWTCRRALPTDRRSQPGERTARQRHRVPRSLAASISPMFAGWLLTLSSFGWRRHMRGVKIIYDLCCSRCSARATA